MNKAQSVFLNRWWFSTLGQINLNVMRKLWGFLLLAISGFIILTSIVVMIETLLKINNHTNSNEVAFRLGYMIGTLSILAGLIVFSVFLIKKGIKLLNK